MAPANPPHPGDRVAHGRFPDGRRLHEVDRPGARCGSVRLDLDAVDIARDLAEGARSACGADEQRGCRRETREPRLADLDPIVLAGEFAAAGVEQLAHDLNRFDVHAGALGAGRKTPADAHDLVLDPARTEPRLEAAARDAIQRERGLGELDGRAEEIVREGRCEGDRTRGVGHLRERDPEMGIGEAEGDEMIAQREAVPAL